MLHSYNSIYNLGHKAIEQLMTVPLQIQEKIDGSQFSFGVVVGGDHEGLQIRSKKALMHPEAPEKMFNKAAESVKAIAHLLTPGLVYRGEYLQKPHHSTLAYARVPKGNIVLYDIDRGGYDMMPHCEVTAEAHRLGLEAVPVLGLHGHSGYFEATNENLRKILDTTESMLGGQKIEGVVLKQIPPVTLWGLDKKPLMAKFVSEDFREVHKRTWGEGNPGPTEVVERIIASTSGPARWRKAVMQLKESGVYTGTPKDIGLLVKAVQEDVDKECKELAAEMLMKHFWPQIRRSSGRGLPEWFKTELNNEALNNEVT
jgi:hypothetical protein